MTQSLLIAPPDGVAFPEGGEAIMLKTPDGLSLRALFFGTPDAVDSGAVDRQGTVFLLQGRAEFLEKYAETYQDLLDRNFAICAIDWRGQGGSTRLLANRRKGHVEEFTDYLIDFDTLIAEATRRGMPKPWHILAHSMGGAITLLALARGPSPFTRAVMSAPLVKVHGLRSEAGTRIIAKLLCSVGLSSAFVPFGGANSIMAKPFEANPLTRDPFRYARSRAWVAKAGPLLLGDATIGWVDAALQALATFDADDFGRENRTPVLMLIAGADTIVCSKASQRLARRMRGASAIVLPGARHELLVETDETRAAFWSGFDAFLRIEAPSVTERPSSSETAQEQVTTGGEIAMDSPLLAAR